MTELSDSKGKKREGHTLTGSTNAKRISLDPLKRISSIPANNSRNNQQKKCNANQTNKVTQLDNNNH